MAISASDVKRLREETDAPMMECKAALEEANGDFERAKLILREKGKAAAAKRADRATGAGVVAISTSQNHQAIGAVVLESETDFVSGNEQFVALAQELAEIFLHHDPGTDPLAVTKGDKSVKDLVEGGVALFRENIVCKRAVHAESETNKFAHYVHHDRKTAVIVEIEGDTANGHDVGRQVAIQVVAFPPEFLHKEQVPQDVIAREMETELQRALNEGKPENIAKNIAQGRINKEFMQSKVLLEQPFYLDSSLTVNQYLENEGKSAGGTIKIVNYWRLAVGE